jgi:hypothetical protein
VSGGWFVFTGTVVDNVSPTGLTIVFGGQLAGNTATVDAQGKFQLVMNYSPNLTGLITAITQDAEGNSSNTATAFI